MTAADCTCGVASREGSCRYCRSLLSAYEYRQRNKERLREASRIRNQRAEVRARKRQTKKRLLAANSAYRERERERVREWQRVTKPWLTADREKMNARAAVWRALRDGRLERQPCEVCGATGRVHGHHEDYSKPLDVRWLCPTHHGEQHRVDAAAAA